MHNQGGQEKTTQSRRSSLLFDSSKRSENSLRPTCSSIKALSMVKKDGPPDDDDDDDDTAAAEEDPEEAPPALMATFTSKLVKTSTRIPVWIPKSIPTHGVCVAGDRCC